MRMRRLAERLRHYRERVKESRYWTTRAPTAALPSRIPLALANSVSNVFTTPKTTNTKIPFFSSPSNYHSNHHFTTSLEEEMTQSFLTSLLPTVSCNNQEGNTLHNPHHHHRRPIIAGNWKCNPSTVEQAKSLLKEIASQASYFRNCEQEVVIFPPMAYLGLALSILKDTGIQVGCQSISSVSGGAYTGEVTSSMVQSMGCSYVMIGHSERRSLFGEDEDDIHAQIQAVLKQDDNKRQLNIILCVGETQEEYEFHLTASVLKNQIHKALRGVSPQDLTNRIVIAYEPVWAIGTGNVATPSYAEEAHNVIRQTISELYSPDIAQQVRVQYGGSVQPNSIQSLMDQPSIDGALVGGASLTFDSFNRIVHQSIPSPTTSSSVKINNIAFTKPLL